MHAGRRGRTERERIVVIHDTVDTVVICWATATVRTRGKKGRRHHKGATPMRVPRPNRFRRQGHPWCSCNASTTSMVRSFGNADTVAQHNLPQLNKGGTHSEARRALLFHRQYYREHGRSNNVVEWQAGKNKGPFIGHKAKSIHAIEMAAVALSAYLGVFAPPTHLIRLDSLGTTTAQSATLCPQQLDMQRVKQPSPPSPSDHVRNITAKNAQHSSDDASPEGAKLPGGGVVVHGP